MMNGYLRVRRSVALVVLVSLAGCAGPTRTVRAQYHPESKPTHGMSAPMGPDGTVMAWPSYFEVLEVMSGPPKP